MQELTVKARELRVGDYVSGCTANPNVFGSILNIDAHGPAQMVVTCPIDSEDWVLPKDADVAILRPDSVPDAGQALKGLRGWVQENAATIDCGGTHGPLEDLEYVNAADLLAKLDELGAKS